MNDSQSAVLRVSAFMKWEIRIGLIGESRTGTMSFLYFLQFSKLFDKPTIMGPGLRQSFRAGRGEWKWKQVIPNLTHVFAHPILKERKKKRLGGRRRKLEMKIEGISSVNPIFLLIKLSFSALFKKIINSHPCPNIIMNSINPHFLLDSRTMEERKVERDL